MPALNAGKLLRLCLSLILLGAGVACNPQKSAEDWFNQGKKFYESRNYDEAIASYNEALKIDPKLVKAYNNRGIAFVAKGQYDQAVADFSKAVELDPKYGKAYNNRAIAYWYKGEEEKAKQDLRKAKELGIPIDEQILQTLPKPEKK